VSSNFSKLEAIKEVRRVLVRHGVDTTEVHFSCYGKSLLLTGGLYKNGGLDLEMTTVEVIMQELNRVGLRITCELENWNITEGRISKKVSSPSAQKEKNPDAVIMNPQTPKK
jgi:hypothetical protein